MSGPQQDNMLAALLGFLGRTDDLPLLYKTLLELRQDPDGGHDILASPLGILALAMSTDSQRAMRTRIVLAALNEMLAREGFGHFDLSMKYADRNSDGLRTLAGWLSATSNSPYWASDAEKARLAWRIQNDTYQHFEQQGYLPLLNSALFQWEWREENMARNDPAGSPIEIWEYSSSH